MNFLNGANSIRPFIVYFISQIIGILVLLGYIEPHHVDGVVQQTADIIVFVTGGVLMIATSVIYLHRLFDLLKHHVTKQVELTKHKADKMELKDFAEKIETITVEEKKIPTSP